MRDNGSSRGVREQVEREHSMSAETVEEGGSVHLEGVGVVVNNERGFHPDALSIESVFQLYLRLRSSEIMLEDSANLGEIGLEELHVFEEGVGDSHISWKLPEL